MTDAPQRAPTVFRSVLEIIYGVYVLLVFLVFGLSAFVAVLLPLGIKARRHIAHFAARAFFTVAGLRIRMIDEHLLPGGPCVVVANHASYLDGIVLKAALPARFSFVIKKEFSRVPLAGLLLRRIGSEFVDRFNRHAGGMDARRLLKAADAGQALAFFPEGTFLAEPGLGKFHSGAFTIAARVDLPVVPLAIRGTRYILPSGRFLPRPGRIDIHVLPSIGPMHDMNNSDAVTHTRDVAHARILAVLGEPDRSTNDGIAALQSRR
ncbi:MAG TPA: lysophospholipid acyltransferase family protein [Steroidobacter sp.]|uniref:lysophospholipid acyltransferase family protein n=1 Tax=Steroidobacter sp. TaxID=1978227 RepID=UPI002ED7B0DF